MEEFHIQISKFRLAFKKKRITNIEIPAKRIKERKSVKQVKHVLLHKGILKLRLRIRETFFFPFRRTVEHIRRGHIFK